jgi:hypothetical protein
LDLDIQHPDIFKTFDFDSSPRRPELGWFHFYGVFTPLFAAAKNDMFQGAS